MMLAAATIINGRTQAKHFVSTDMPCISTHENFKPAWLNPDVSRVSLIRVYRYFTTVGQ